MDQPALHIEFFGLNLQDPIIGLKFGGMYSALFRALRKAGAEVTYSAKSVSESADLIITSPSWPQENLEVVAARITAPIVFYAPAADLWHDRRLLSRYRDRILFAYGTAISEPTTELYQGAGLDYHYLPLGTDPEIMRPLQTVHKRLYDLVFAGSLEHRLGCEPFVTEILQNTNARTDLLLTTGGERFGIPAQTVTWGPVLNLLYNLSKVGVNFHSAEQKQGAGKRLDLNNRVFDLAAAGCFQISDNVAAVRECFAADEVLAFDDPNEWMEAALYYCSHPEETLNFRERARERVLNEHTWDHRASQLLKWIEAALAQRTIVRKRISPPRWLHTRRRLGGTLRRLGMFDPRS